MILQVGLPWNCGEEVLDLNFPDHPPLDKAPPESILLVALRLFWRMHTQESVTWSHYKLKIEDIQPSAEPYELASPT